MKTEKKYTKKQIREAIAHWTKVLESMENKATVSDENLAVNFGDGYLHFDEQLKAAGLTVSDINQIYCGWCHFSRNSGGDYYKKGTPEFNAALQDMRRADFEVLEPGDPCRDYDGGQTVSDGVVIDKRRGFMDIPWNSDDDMCYCLYFD